MIRHLLIATFLLSAACGGSAPPPKTDEDTSQTAAKPERTGPAPSVSQELGSIDERAVIVMFDKLQSKFEVCHKQGRDRIEYLSGDIKVFMRVGQDGKVRYSYFDETTVGDRETEKCILDVVGAADWPKPTGGEAEVRNGFGWSAGGERQPTPWGAEKVTGALDEDKGTKEAVGKCKGGVSGEFRITAYVEPGDVEGAAATPKANAKGKPGKKPGRKGDKKGPHAASKTSGGKFKALGIAPPGKEGADKVDCIVDALRGLSLPSPGSYAAKVTFTL